jgi:TonB family protein
MPPTVTAANPDLNLLRPLIEPVTAQRLVRNTAASIVVHILMIAFFFELPEVERKPERRMIENDIQKAVHLTMPRYFEPTQRAANQGKITRELDVNSMRQTPEKQAPRFRAPAPLPGPVAQAAPAPVPMPVIEQPKIEVAQAIPPPTATAPPQPPAPTPPPQPARPKLSFEDVASVPLQTSNPNPTSRQTASSSNPRSETPGANGTIVGDIGDSTQNIPGANQAPSAGRIGSNLQLLSDAKGVDFKPYLIQVLMSVRRNWLAIIPESARLGRRGRVLIQFAIDRNGGVPKLVIAEGTGTEALDRAAVAAVSASYPFPPLPTDYKGDEIRLQLAFGYNIPTTR